MAELFHLTGAFSFRSPICFADGFKKMSIDFKDASVHAIVMLCHRISSSLQCAAFPVDDHNICAVFQANTKQELTSFLQRETSAANTKQELTSLLQRETSEANPKQELTSFLQRETSEMTLDMEDDEISTGLLLRQAIQESLFSYLISCGWTRLDGRILIFGKLDEPTSFETVSVDVQLSTNDQVVLLLSADVVTFHLTKAVESLPEACKWKFDNGKEILTDEYLWKLDEWPRNDHECRVLPSLRGGHIVGFRKSLQEQQNVEMEQQKEIWISHNGLRVPSPCYYVQVCFDKNPNDLAWFPANLVVTKAGLIPVLPSHRCSKLLQVVEHCKNDIAEWNFFGAGKVKLQEILKNDIKPAKKPLWTSSAACSREISTDGFDITLFSDLKLDVLQKFLRARQGVEREPETEAHPPRNTPRTFLPKAPLIVPNFKRTPRIHARAPAPKQPSQANDGNNDAGGIKPSMKPSRKPKEPPDSDKENKKLKTSSQKKRTVVQTNKTSSAKDVTDTRNAEEPMDLHLQDTGAGKLPAANTATKGVEADPVETQVLKKHAEGKLKDLNVAELKSFLRIRKGKIGGKKEEIIQRICDLLS